MPNPFLNPGAGTALRKVTASTGNALAAPETTVIPDAGYTEIVAAHEGAQMIFLFIFAAAATGTVVIEEVIDSSASVAGETFATETVTADRVHRWNAGEPLTGYFRIKNTSGQNMTVYYNQAKKGS